MVETHIPWRDKVAALQKALGRPATLDELVAEGREHTMSADETAEQRSSFVRGMTTPCEHGVLDFEQCAECRADRWVAKL